MADPYKSASGDAQSFGRRGYVVTPGSSDLADVAKGLVVLSAGDATIIPVGNTDSQTLPFTDLPAGAIIPYQVRRVTAATAVLATIEG